MTEEKRDINAELRKTATEYTDRAINIAMHNCGNCYTAAIFKCVILEKEIYPLNIYHQQFLCNDITHTGFRYYFYVRSDDIFLCVTRNCDCIESIKNSIKINKDILIDFIEIKTPEIPGPNPKDEEYCNKINKLREERDQAINGSAKSARVKK
jgi:hypothetical protein